MSKSLTVAVASYNSQDYIKRCIESVIPALDDIELVIVDDGSTDATTDIVEEFVSKYPRDIRLIRKEHGGYGSAINWAMHDVATPWFRLLDADDCFLPEGLNSLLKVLRQQEDDPASSDLIVNDYVYRLLMSDGTERISPHHFDNVFPQTGHNSWARTKNFNVDQILGKQSITYSTRLLGKVNLHVPDHSRYADHVFAYEPLPHVRRIYYLDEEVYSYTLGRTGQAASMEFMVDDVDNIISLALDMFRRVRLDSVRPQKLQRYMYNHMARLIAVCMIPLRAEIAGTNAVNQQMELIWRDFANINANAARHLKAMPMLNSKRLMSSSASYLNKDVYNLIGKVFIL
ncbi:MAG: glycosyltransferase family 2 protein [Eubacteriales bacterium]|nr:glycosyltransferase family 2 protein [Eubacteriales bacterium]